MTYRSAFHDLGLNISFISISVNSHEFQRWLPVKKPFPALHRHLIFAVLAFLISMLNRDILHYIQITIISVLIEISKVCDCTAKSTKHFSACQNLCILEEECTFLQVQINLPNFFRLALKFSFHKKRGTN